MQYPIEQIRRAIIHKIHAMVKECTRCQFHLNGQALPFFGTNAKYLMIGEAPHVKEIEEGWPFVGDSGTKMWNVIYDVIGLVRDDFIIFNSVLCKPDVPPGKTLGKPTKTTIAECFVKRTDVLSYIHNYFNIRNILVLGNYARYIFTGQMGGIDAVCGTSVNHAHCGKDFTLTYCLHPAAFGYNPSNKEKFESAIKAFGTIVGVNNGVEQGT